MCAYTRTLGDEKDLVLFNFSKDPINWFSSEFNRVKKKVLVSNYEVVPSENFMSHAYEAVVYKVE